MSPQKHTSASATSTGIGRFPLIHANVRTAPTHCHERATDPNPARLSLSQGSSRDGTLFPTCAPHSPVHRVHVASQEWRPNGGPSAAAAAGGEYRVTESVLGTWQQWPESRRSAGRDFLMDSDSHPDGQLQSWNESRRRGRGSELQMGRNQQSGQ